jgi:hypothetical protein
LSSLRRADRRNHVKEDANRTVFALLIYVLLLVLEVGGIILVRAIVFALNY